VFPDAGQTILRSREGDGAEIWCRCDGGPHGFLSIAAHAHADALSVEVRHDGIDILADPGTYCYHGEREWREWFRSTAAHNTVEIDGLSSADSGGPFLWNSRPRTETTTCDVGAQPIQVWSARHDGYRRLPHRTVHRRTVTLDSPARLLTIIDTLDSSAEFSLTLWWHLGPDVTVELEGAEARLAWHAGGVHRRATLALPEALGWTSHTAETTPICGWYAPRFGRRVPATALAGRASSTSVNQLVTVLRLP
jgi:hypothetical protein